MGTDDMLRHVVLALPLQIYGPHVTKSCEKDEGTMNMGSCCFRWVPSPVPLDASKLSSPFLGVLSLPLGCVWAQPVRPAILSRVDDPPVFTPTGRCGG